MGFKLEEISANSNYGKNGNENNDNGDEDEDIWTISGRKIEEERVYTYDEAIELTGNGWYNMGLLITLVLAVQSMGLDMFSFSYVVAAAACDLQLSHNQTSFLLSVPLIGAIASSYLYGYISDTRGRKTCINSALWGSFILASLSALSPNFIVLAVLKLFSCSISSGIQSMAYTLLGESCGARIKGRYLLILTSSLVCGYAMFTTHAYIVLGLDFSYDMGLIVFKPWRLLILTLSMGLGFSAVLICFFYESPKYLVSAGRTVEALKILSLIKKRNGGGDNYPVKKLILLETKSWQCDNVSFLRSLWDHTAPLFMPPLLQWTLILFYISASIYSVNNGFFLWIPVLTSKIFEDSTLPENVTENFCNLLTSSSVSMESAIESKAQHAIENVVEGVSKNVNCTSAVSLETLIVSIIHGVSFVTINFGVAMLAHKKKALIIFIFMFSSFSCYAMEFVPGKYTTLVFFFTMQSNCFIMGVVFCYFIELYPTRYRGMITCLGVMVARGSGMVGVQLVGGYIFSHCTTSLYAWGVYIFSGALVALLLPPDTPKKS